MRELLVIADKKGTKQPAFYHALEIAKNTNSLIEFVGFVHASGVDSSEILTDEEKRKVRHSYIDKKQIEISNFLKDVDLGNVQVKTDVVWEKSFERWISARCTQKSFDMVFKTGNRSENFLYTPSDWQLMRHCPDPVMIVGDNPWKEGGIILAAIDLSSENKEIWSLNEKIIKKAQKLAASVSAEVHACYTMAVPTALVDLGLVDYESFEVSARSKIDPAVDKIISDMKLPRERIHLLMGKPHKEICRLSKEINADLVIIGNKTKNSLRGRLLGSTAENVLSNVSADVVVIK
ncbi:MAG: universal stress protein [Gammaproteobacteria bacterium]|nr:universal stress protein [Gammaproteobacteria bacterium]MDH5631129.1 universal stress protein [Gammaproteobacteria bacterium]